MRQRHWNPSLSEIRKTANAMLRYFSTKEPADRKDWVEGRRLAEYFVRVAEMPDLNKDAVDDLLHEVENCEYVGGDATGFNEMYVWVKKLGERMG